MRKLKILLLVAIVSIALFIPADVYAESNEGIKDIKEQMNDNVDKQLSSLDTTMFDSFIYSLDSNSYKIFSSSSFGDKLKSVIKGEVFTDYHNIFEIILALFLSDAVKLIPIMASICALSILCNLLTLAKSQRSKSGEIVHFVCYISIVLVVLNVIYQLITSLTATLTLINDFMSMVFPIILTLMVASGSAVSSSIYQPAVALLCSSVVSIFVTIIVPLFIASIILNVVSNFTDNIKVSKFAEFFKSTGQWITGITFTVFLSFLSIQGISASTYDSVSVRAVKYAIGNSIPIVGGYIKEGFDLILGSTVLIKNAVGVTGLLLLLAYIISPVINILVCMLGFKLTAAVIEPVSDNKIPNFLQSVSKSFNLIMAAFLSVSFMFFITIMLMIMTSNAVLV